MTTTVAARFADKYEVMPSGCWQWRAATSPNGYGKFWFGGKVEQAHRASFAIHGGELREGLVLDHLCRNRGCVNPSHLELVTQRENLLRGETSVARQVTSTHCANGHTRTANTRVNKDGSRSCVACIREIYRPRLRAKARACEVLHEVDVHGRPLQVAS